MTQTQLHPASEKYMRDRHHLSNIYLHYSVRGNEQNEEALAVHESLPHIKRLAAGDRQLVDAQPDILLPPGGKESYCAEDFFAPANPSQSGEEICSNCSPQLLCRGMKEPKKIVYRTQILAAVLKRKRGATTAIILPRGKKSKGMCHFLMIRDCHPGKKFWLLLEIQVMKFIRPTFQQGIRAI